MFKIDEHSGQINVIGPLDREYSEEFLIVVIVEDLNAENSGGTNSDLNGKNTKSRQTASTPIKIIVDDINDNAPKFKKPFYSSTVRENADIGTVVTTIVSKDLDKNRTISYR